MDAALVTGGAGFLGSHVADHLLRAGLRVVVLDDMSGGFWRNLPQGAEFCHGSITDGDCIAALFECERFRYVFHLAAYAAEGLSHFIRNHNYMVNVVGSVNLINAAVNCDTECFVFASSIAVYGAGQLPLQEDAIPTPEDPYGIAKLAIEQDLAAAHRLFGLRYVIFRPHNIYGERQNLSDPYRNVVGIFMTRALAGRRCTVFGDGMQTRAFSHVSQVAPLIAQSVTRPAAWNETFNVGAERTVTINELAEMVQRALGRRVGIEHLPPREDVLHAQVDHRKARSVFESGGHPKLEEGLRRMARWAETLEIAPPRRFDPIEIVKNLPPSWRRLTRPDDQPGASRPRPVS